MTGLVSVKINDGVVMAADSASSFASGMIYNHAQEIVNLRRGLPIGAMMTGAGGIGNDGSRTRSPCTSISGEANCQRFRPSNVGWVESGSVAGVLHGSSNRGNSLGGLNDGMRGSAQHAARSACPGGCCTGSSCSANLRA